MDGLIIRVRTDEGEVGPRGSDLQHSIRAIEGAHRPLNGGDSVVNGRNPLVDGDEEHVARLDAIDWRCGGTFAVGIDGGDREGSNAGIEGAVTGRDQTVRGEDPGVVRRIELIDVVAESAGNFVPGEQDLAKK